MRGGRGPGAPGACAGACVFPSLSSLGPTAALASLSLRSLASTASTRDAAAPRRHRRAGVSFLRRGPLRVFKRQRYGRVGEQQQQESCKSWTAHLALAICCGNGTAARKNGRVSYELVEITTTSRGSAPSSKSREHCAKRQRSALTQDAPHKMPPSRRSVRRAGSLSGTRFDPVRPPSGSVRGVASAGRASGPAPVGGPVRRRAPVRPRPGPSDCVRPRPGPDLPSGAPSGTGLVASMLASARRRAPSGAKFPRPEVSVGRPVRRRRPDRTSGRGPLYSRAPGELVGTTGVNTATIKQRARAQGSLL